MVDLWLLRHAESHGNVDGTGSDSALTPAGAEAAAALGVRLNGHQFDHVYCSPLLRARETAALAVPGLVCVFDPALRELESARAPTWVDPADPDSIAALLAQPVAELESGRAFMARVTAWLASMPSSGSVLAITHFAVIREVLSTLLGFRRAPQQIHFTALFRLTLGGAAPEVLIWNDVSSSEIVR